MLPAALSNKFTADAVVFTGRGLFRGFSYLETSGSAGLTVAFYDAAAVGDTTKPLVPGVTAAQATGDVVSLGAMVAAVERGLVMDITGAGTVTVFYNPETRWLHELNIFNTGDEDVSTAWLARMYGAELAS